MEENTATPTTQPQPERMSFSDKLMNVFASPGDLFGYVAQAGKESSNWIIPLIASLAAGLFFTLYVFTQEPIKEQMKDQQLKALQERVEQGKMTKEEYDATIERMPDPGSPMWLTFSAIGVTLITALTLFVSALGFWLVAKFAFKATAPYGKYLEVVGLSTYISIVGTLVSMVFIVAMGSLYAGPSLALLVSNFNPTDKVDRILASANILSFWYLSILSIGVSKVGSISTGKGFIVVFGLWVLYIAATIFIGFGS